MIASVVVDIKTDAVNRTFDYLVPDFLETSVKIGQRVSVPFGPQKVLGFIVGLKETTDYPKTLKPIYELLDIIPCLNQELVTLAYNMHKYYFSLFITCLFTMIPAALRAKYDKRFVLNPGMELPFDLATIFNEGSLDYSKKYQEYLPSIQEALKKKIIRIENVITNQANVKMATYLHLNDGFEYKLNSSQQEIIDYFSELDNDPLKSEIVDIFSAGRIQTLAKNKVISEYQQEVMRKFDKDKTYADKKVIFNENQARVYQEIIQNYNEFKTILLHGVTGSGKTEIYLQLIEDVVGDGKTAILLVPEISLTPQIVGRIKGRFMDNVAVMHSGLSIGEKYDEWRRIINKEVKIVVGARSAIFAPLENIGIIIIDEEHEASYKQDNEPRYDARMIARIRAKHHNCPCLLGSATPSIESYYQAEIGRYQLLELTERANHKDLPPIKLVNMVNELKSGNRSLFSNELKNLISDRLNKKEQSILLLNRRGFSSFVMCRECGEVVKCPHCEVSLTYHKNDDSLKCHYCGYQMANIKNCPNCHSNKVRFVGGGTQKVVEEINKLYPEAKVLRMDMDNTKNKGAHEKIITSFLNGEADILVGTQMVAKGLDFPKCSLVGILNSDLALKYPTFLAPAQAYNLFVQVSGRAGRHDTDGVVILQGYDVEHYAIMASKNDNYQAFYDQEIKYRKLGNYPPFVKLVEIMVIAKGYEDGFKEASLICDYIRNKSQVKVLGPAEDFIVKINDQYRFIITIKFNDDKVISDILEQIYVKYETSKEYKIIINRM